MKFQIPNIKIIVTFFIVGLVLYGGYSLYTYARDSPYLVTAQQAKKAIQDGKVDIVLDVRTKQEKDLLGFYPGSFHIPSGELEARLPREFPNKGTRFLVYCNTGQRARAATDKMRAMGYNYVNYIATSHVSLF